MPDQFIQKPGGEPVKLTETINPVTNLPFANLQEASDIGSFSPVAAPVIGIDESKNQISQGSDDQRDASTDLQNQLDQLSGDDGGVDTAGIDLGAEFEKLKQQSANIGLTTTEELAQIESAGSAAGAEYAPLISDAQERARMGQAANIVATGRRGGFQRARYAGEAALGPTVGDVGYEGAGGKLEASASAYQRNIDALKSQRMRAVELAKAQARQAIRTGKQQDFTNAASMLDFARQMDADAKKAEQDMFDNLFKMKQEERAESAEDRLGERLEFDKDKFAIGEERLNRTSDLAEARFNYEISQDMTKKTLENIKNMANSGIPLDQLDDEEINKLEYEAEMEPGTFEAFYSNLLEERVKGELIDSLKIDKMKADISNIYSTISNRGKTDGSDLSYNEGLFQTAQELIGMRDKGMLSDPSYDQLISEFIQDQGLESEDPEANQAMYDKITSQVNDIMGGRHPFIEQQTTEDVADDILAGFGYEPTETFEEQGLGKFGTGEGIEGLKSFGKSYWDTMTEADKSKILPKAWFNKGWEEVKQYLFGK